MKNQFLAGLLTLAITVITAAVAIPEAAWADAATLWQFGGLVVSTAVVIFLPLSKGKWAASIKVIGSLVAALVANVVALLTTEGDWGFTQWLLIGLALLNALAAELGVNARIAELKSDIVDNGKSTDAARAADPAGVAVATRQLALAA